MATILAFLASFSAGAIVKVLSMLGLSFLEPILKHYQSKDYQDAQRTGMFTQAMIASLEAEVSMKRIASEERVALWGSTAYKLLVYAIVLPPALYNGAVFLDSIVGFDAYTVDAAPGRFEEAGFTILYTFIGAGGAVGAVTGAAKMWRR